MIQPGYAALGSGGSYGSGNGSHDGSVNEGNIAHHANGMSHESMGQMQQPEYTLAGILHFLQSEWRRYERDRNEWEIERAEMRVSVSFTAIRRVLNIIVIIGESSSARGRTQIN